MAHDWVGTSLLRTSITAASTVSGAGFSAVKAGTRLGFSITRGITANAAGLTGYAVDHMLFGGKLGAGSILKDAVSSVVSFAEQLVFLPILLGEGITTTSLLAAHSSVNALSVFFPGSDEASFSLASFVELCRREWNEPGHTEHLPETSYGATEIAKALVAWGALQGMTNEWKEKCWLKHMREVPVLDHLPSTPRPTLRRRRSSRVHVNSDVILSMNRGQLVTADIGERSSLNTIPASPTSPTSAAIPVSPPTSTRLRRVRQPKRLSNEELKTTLRRLSKLVLAGYGGASLLFFGVSPIPSWRGTSSSAKEDREVNVATAVAASEAEAAPTAEGATEDQQAGYSWWNVLMGRHDQDIFHAFANQPPTKDTQERLEQRNRVVSAIVGDHNLMPRFWVLKDHGRKQVVLVIRGTMSLNEIAVDLTCDAEPFNPASEDDPNPNDELYSMPGHRSSSGREDMPGKYQVHGGMLRMSKAMGGIGRPVHVALKDALKQNPEYDLVLCGHSLGAGVAALLGLTWADPRTCLTVPSSGLPINRRTSVYCFAPPCVTDAALGRLAEPLITSFVYSHDVVSRLSIRTCQDLRRAALWLCDANAKELEDNTAPAEGYASVTKRALKAKAGFSSKEDPNWFLAMRKTLEANMNTTVLFPPGRVWWALRDGDLHPNNRLPEANDKGKEKVRLFEVLNVEEVFAHIIFATDMLSSHLPHKYDRVLHELL